MVLLALTEPEVLEHVKLQAQALNLFRLNSLLYSVRLVTHPSTRRFFLYLVRIVPSQRQR